MVSILTFIQKKKPKLITWHGILVVFQEKKQNAEKPNHHQICPPGREIYQKILKRRNKKRWGFDCQRSYVGL